MDVQLHTLASALDGGNDQFHVPAALTPGKDRPIATEQGLSGPQRRSGLCIKKFGLDTLRKKHPLEYYLSVIYMQSSKTHKVF